jgi:hypothetical protein
MAKLSFVIVSALFAVGWAVAQSPSYVRTGSIGKADTSNVTRTWHQYRYLPMNEWEGKRVVFLPQPLELRKFGYLQFKGGSGEFGASTYDEAAGKTGRIVSVANSEYPQVTIRMDESGKEYVGTIYRGVLEDIAFLDEIDLARKEIHWNDPVGEVHGSVNVR